MNLANLMRREAMELKCIVVTGVDSFRAQTDVHNIVIVHAMPLVGLGLSSIIAETGAFADYKVSAFTKLGEAVAQVSQAKSGDVILLDIEAWSWLTNPDNLTLLQRLKARGPCCGVIAPMTQLRASNLETDDLLGSIALEAELHDIIAMVKDLSASRDCKQEISPHKAPKLSSLTDRQLNVLALIAEGHSNKQIAKELGLTDQTVKYYVTKIFKKLGCQQRTQAAVAFLKNSC